MQLELFRDMDCVFILARQTQSALTDLPAFVVVPAEDFRPKLFCAVICNLNLKHKINLNGFKLVIALLIFATTLTAAIDERFFSHSFVQSCQESAVKHCNNL
uniref:Uncharacterized protein n=1 Tax=Strigamia maritima TaxID=126957 RepID=T1J9V4_STRMM